MKLIISLKVVDKFGHSQHESSVEIDNFADRKDLYSVIKLWIFEATIALKQKFTTN